MWHRPALAVTPDLNNTASHLPMMCLYSNEFFSSASLCPVLQESILSILLDIVIGMEHIHSKNIIHGATAVLHTFRTLYKGSLYGWRLRCCNALLCVGLVHLLWIGMQPLLPLPACRWLIG